jgi:hypothetical protein
MGRRQSCGSRRRRLTLPSIGLFQLVFILFVILTLIAFITAWSPSAGAGRKPKPEKKRWGQVTCVLRQQRPKPGVLLSEPPPADSP